MSVDYVIRDGAFSAHTNFQPILCPSTEGDSRVPRHVRVPL